MKIRYVIKYNKLVMQPFGISEILVDDYIKDEDCNLITFETGLDCVDYIEENKLNEQYNLLFIETIVV